MQLVIKASLRIQKPAHEVFHAIVEPQQMSNYFIATASGKLESGKEIVWKFPEFDMEFPVHVKNVEKNKYISFTWDDFDGTKTLVEIELEATAENETYVRIKEGSRGSDEAGIGWYGRNTEGWANFLACLKAWLEYGINLRKGAFDASQIPAETLK